MDLDGALEGQLAVFTIREKGQKFEARLLDIGEEVTPTFRGIAKRCIEKVQTGSHRQYDPGDTQDGYEYLTVDPDDILDRSLINCIEPINRLEVWEEVGPWGRSQFCYGVAIGDSVEGRTIFLRKHSPYKNLEGKIWTRWIDRSLNQITDPVFAFDDTFDVIIRNGEVVILNQVGFDALFKDSEVVNEHVGRWCATIFGNVRCNSVQIADLAARSAKNGRLRKKLQSIARKPNIETLDVDRIKAMAERYGVDHSSFLDNGELQITPENQMAVLSILNEDFKEGDYSGVVYRVSAKSPHREG